MAGGYKSKPEGEEYFIRKFRAIDAALAALRAANKLISAVVGSGGIKVVDGGSVEIEGGDLRVRDGGRMTADYPTGERAVQFGPVYFDGDTSRPPDGHGILIETQDGTDVFRAAQMADGTVQSMLAGGGVSIWAMGGDFQIFGLPTSTQPGNLRLQVGTNGEPQIYYGTNSNEENKPDLRPLDLAAADVLAIEPQEWTEGEDRVVGATVEQIKSIPAVSPFLLRPRYGGGENLEHDRIAILQQVVLRDLESRVSELEEKVVSQDRIIAALCEHVGIDPQELA